MFKDLVDFADNRIFALLSTVFFFVLFTGIVVKVMFMKKSHVTKMSNLPLEDGAPFAAQQEDRP